LVRLAETELSMNDRPASHCALTKATEAIRVIRRFLSKPLGLDAEQVRLLTEKCNALTASIEKIAAQM